MKLFLATANSHKVEELSVLLGEHGAPVTVYGASEVEGMPEVEETEDTFVGNARLKAEALRAMMPQGAWALADDSGLEVDALLGRPGVCSARYAGPDASDSDNFMKLLTELSDVPDTERTARFTCCLVLLDPDGREWVFTGHCNGVIAKNPAGDQGFGYDPVFIPDGRTQSLAQLGSAVKNEISHRARAIEYLVSELMSLLGRNQ